MTTHKTTQEGFNQLGDLLAQLKKTDVKPHKRRYNSSVGNDDMLMFITATSNPEALLEEQLKAGRAKVIKNKTQSGETPFFTLADKLALPSGKKIKKMKAHRQTEPSTQAVNTKKDSHKAQASTSRPAKTTEEQPGDNDNEQLEWDNYLNGSTVAHSLDASDNADFAKAMYGVKPLIKKGRELQPATSFNEKSGQNNPNKTLQDLIDGKLEFSLEYSGEFVQCQVVGLDALVIEKLRAGQYSPEAHIDLHGLNAEQAYTELLRFIRHSYQRNLRNVIVVTGRGLNSPNGISVLRERIQNWLTRDPFKRVVLAFCTAKQYDGGTGALYVLLRKYKKSRGKIFWDRLPSPEELDV